MQPSWDSPQYWLLNAHCPGALLPPDCQGVTRWDGLMGVDLCIQNGKISRIKPTDGTTAENAQMPVWDLAGRLILPGFVDLHTHLDKGHIGERSPNLEGIFDTALTIASQDAMAHWTTADLYRRMVFGLHCSYAHGTQAVRTHLDAINGLYKISFELFAQLQAAWRDRVTLQAVSLTTLADYLTPAGVEIADRVAELGAILGGVAYMNPALDIQLDRVFQLALERDLAQLDFHADETNDPASITLQKIAAAAIRNRYDGQIVCGHCCSLAQQSPAVVDQTINLVRESKIAIVSLPLCNLYLQDRVPGRTPRWRGITLVHELKAAGVPVIFASDNCRDPFFGYGDHDMLEVFTQAVRIAHLDTPHGDWIRSVTDIPSQIMGLPAARLMPGQTANFILFQERYWSELLSRGGRDRVIIRNGTPIQADLPDYAHLDHP